MVIPDADIWIDLLNDETLPTSRALGALIRNQEVVLTGIALSEILRGTRDQEGVTVNRLLQRVRYVEMSREAWTRSGRIAADLDAKGTPIPMTDVHLAALAIELDHQLFTRDKHFERISGLRFYNWEKDDA